MTTTALDYTPKRNRPIASARALDPAIAAGTATGPRTRMLANAKAGLAQPFKGLSADGEIEPGLFKLAPSGISTEPVLRAARAFLAALSPEERAAAQFDIEAQEWRSWSNVHPFLMRHGACMDYMTDAGREAALALMEASFSAAGFKEARDVMRLNYTIGEITDRLGPEYDEYGEWLYWISVFGEPSEGGPWGWQVDGHHLNVSIFVLGDQMVFTPFFDGSEPILAPWGKFEGTRVCEAQEAQGLALMQSLSDEQRTQALLKEGLPGEMFAGAFNDNHVMDYAGTPYADMTAAQQGMLHELIETYVMRARDGHNRLWMQEVESQLQRTRFGWIGACDDEAVFYYRIHSPVILIEFDHQRGVALEADDPTRNHIHTIVRTPNGNDYGKDLLRQHYATSPHHR
jgi:hypothetical protein